MCVGGGSGRAGHKARRCVFFYQQPQLHGTKALLLRDHVTVWVSVFHPCHVIWAQGRVWEMLSRCQKFFPPREQADMQAGRGDGRRDRRLDGRDKERNSPATFSCNSKKKLSTSSLCGFLNRSQAKMRRCIMTHTDFSVTRQVSFFVCIKY